MAELNVNITELSVSVLPEDHRERSLWTVKVVWRSPDLYAVEHGGYVLNTDGEWEYEPQPSSRDDEFKARTRFNYLTAYAAACHWARLVTANGMTAADVLAKEATRA